MRLDDEAYVRFHQYKALARLGSVRAIGELQVLAQNRAVHVLFVHFNHGIDGERIKGVGVVQFRVLFISFGIPSLVVHD